MNTRRLARGVFRTPERPDVRLINITRTRSRAERNTVLEFAWSFSKQQLKENGIDTSDMTEKVQFVSLSEMRCRDRSRACCLYT